tara:strand:- start:142 stop:510 length:369 start_codon:yes stop_codon:yes gene_type:complete
MNEAIKYAFKYIEELETQLENKEIERKELCEYAADIRAVAYPKETERDAYRKVYEHLYFYDRKTFLNKLPSEYLLKDEHCEWFDNAYDDYLFRGDPIANMSLKEHAQYLVDDVRKELPNEIR